MHLLHKLLLWKLWNFITHLTWNWKPLHCLIYTFYNRRLRCTSSTEHAFNDFSSFLIKDSNFYIKDHKISLICKTDIPKLFYIYKKGLFSYFLWLHFELILKFLSEGEDDLKIHYKIKAQRNTLFTQIILTCLRFT